MFYLLHITDKHQPPTWRSCLAVTHRDPFDDPSRRTVMFAHKAVIMQLSQLTQPLNTCSFVTLNMTLGTFFLSVTLQAKSRIQSQHCLYIGLFLFIYIYQYFTKVSTPLTFL